MSDTWRGTPHPLATFHARIGLTCGLRPRCAEQKIEPTTQAVFGKLLCEVFGEIKSRYICL